MSDQAYFDEIETVVKQTYDLCNQARAKGFDPKPKVEIPLAKSLAEKCVGLISTVYPQLLNSGITERILDLEKSYGKLDPTVSFVIAEEVAHQKFCSFESTLEAMDAGIRIGFAYTTLGVVSSPIEGYTSLKVGKTKEGKEYLKAYFSGPIRSAGTTASCIVLMLIDYMREVFGYAKYDPSEEEVKRYITENYDYHERVTNLQYCPMEKEIEFLAARLPIQLCGEPTEKLEVSNYKNLARVETNNIRGGMCLVFSEGLAQKAKKGFRLYNAAKANGVTATGWDFLDEFLNLQKELTSAKGKGKKGGGVPTYIRDLVAGRPVFGHPSRSGSLRFRYGRSRVSGFSAASIHPATMAITDDFIATGTQLKIEKPTKGCTVTPCDTIMGPIVKLKNGSVKYISTKEEARKIYSDVEEILYLGDVLFPFSDVVNRNYDLLKPGYVSEWWHLELKEKDLERAKTIHPDQVSFEEAIDLSQQYGLPLHPLYVPFWTQISSEEFAALLSWLSLGHFEGKLLLPFAPESRIEYAQAKRALELIGLPHQVTLEHVLLPLPECHILFSNLGLDLSFLSSGEGSIQPLLANKDFSGDDSVLSKINSQSLFVIKDTAGDFIGSRMGRPEKAKLRKLTGSPNVLFPVGEEGGRLRSVQEACSVGHVKTSAPLFYSPETGKMTLYPRCEESGVLCEPRYYYRDTKEISSEPKKEEREGLPYSFQEIPIGEYFERAREKLGLRRDQLPPLVKGIRGMSSDSKAVEHLAKGILRAKHNLQVNKDGTIRMDATELPLLSFRPLEVGTSVSRLKELGYEIDVYGAPLERDDQILELKPHDVLIPSSPETPDEKGEDIFTAVCNFVDDELEYIYGLPRFHNISSKEDLIGQYGACMAPHNCAGVVCRFIGFSNTLGFLASPYMHAAMRRDCDGDEAAVMLLSDVLLNFSRSFLPGHRGGTQDAPLVLNARIEAGEVDDQILDLEACPEFTYPLELYQLAEQRKHSSEVKSILLVKDLLRENKNPFEHINFTHDTSDFNDSVICSAYKLLETMQDKVRHQMELVERIRAADTADTARLVIERHFIRDMRGNLRKFSMQQFRCVQCNEIIRRPPLNGRCPACGRGKIIFTIHEGGIKKYLEPAIELITTYNLSPYIKQSIEITKRYIDSVFGKETEKQEALSQWV